jgi:ankyrin repeat protein
MAKYEPNQRLFEAIAFAELPGVPSSLHKIERAFNNGADLDGFFEYGETPLTEAIMGGMGSPDAVKELLRLGANPDVKDKNGWNPWAACIMRIDDPYTSTRMKKIKELLLESGADQTNEIFLQLQQEVVNGNISRVEELLNEGVDPDAPIICPLGCAIENEDLNMVKLLLRHNASPEGNENETCLMNAAKLGNLELVKILVNAGASISAYAWDDKRFTARSMATENGHKKVADWLKNHTSDDVIAEQEKEIKSRNPKFLELYEKNTNGIDFGFDTDDIAEKLGQWDSKYGIDISEVEHDGFIAKFNLLPDDLIKFSKEVYEFCPDIIDQGYGCMDGLAQMMTDSGCEIDPKTAELIKDIDFKDDDFGLLILQRDLKSTMSLSFWWD